MQHRWLPLLLLVLVGPLLGAKPALSLEKTPELTVLYTANTYGKKQPCPV